MGSTRIKIPKISKKNFIILAIGLVVVLIGLTFIIGSRITTFVVGPEILSPPEAAFYFTPSSGSVTEGENFTVDLMVDTKGKNIVAGSTYVKYDPVKILIQSIDTASSIFSYEVENIIDGANGMIKITRGQPGDSVTNDSDDGFTGDKGKIATLSIKALNEAPATKLDILKEKLNSAALSRSILDDGKGTDILTTVGSGTFSIAKQIITPPSPSKIRVKLDMQGRITNNAVFKAEIIDKNSGQVIKAYENIQSSNDGSAEIIAPDLPKNTYDLRIVVPKYLPAKMQNVLMPDDVTQFALPTLLAGNFSDEDSVINELDVGVLNRKWNTNTPNIDIDQDGKINETEWVFINRNWGKKGE